MFYIKTFCVKMSKLWEGGGFNRASDNVQICARGEGGVMAFLTDWEAAKANLGCQQRQHHFFGTSCQG